jgi:hypothetical protein
MTSNMVDCFNNVLKGVRALLVIAIAEYTFQKLSAYFQKHSMEADKLMDMEKMYPEKVDEWMELPNSKSERQNADCFDNNEWIYQVNEPGETTQDSVQFGGRSFKVSLKTRECSCKRPSLIHLPCSHLITAVDLDHPEMVRLKEFTLETVART